MKEIETKAVNVNCKKIKERLIELGAEKIFKGKIEGHYFDSKDLGTKDKGQIVRVRKIGDKNFLTFKGKKEKMQGVVTREEIEVEISEIGPVIKILESIGFKEYLRYSKDRTSYSFEEARFEFDRYLYENSFIPEFMEIEAENMKEVLRLAKVFDIPKKNLKDFGFEGLVDMFKSP